MRRRRWAPLAAACLVALVVLLAAVHCIGAPGAAGAPMPAPGRSGAAFDTAVASSVVARCKKQRKRAAGAAACVGLPGRGAGAGDGDDKRVVPTGSNPLHNR